VPNLENYPAVAAYHRRDTTRDGCLLMLGIAALLLGTPILWLVGLTLRPLGHGAWVLGAVGLAMAVGIFIIRKCWSRISRASDERRY
jgi:hypothetical protein